MVTIYRLSHPETGEVRYVGKTGRPRKERLQEHRRSALAEGEKDPVHWWIRSLLREGFDPVMDVLDEVPDEVWEERESYWIEFYRRAGARLLNVMDGGQGRSVGFKVSDETRARMIEVKKDFLTERPELLDKLSRSHADPQWREKVGDFHRGRKRSPETCEKIRASKLGRKQSPEAVEKRRRSILARNAEKRAAEGTAVSPETRARLSEANRGQGLGRKLPEETRAKMSAVRKGRPGRVWTDEQRSAMSARMLARKKSEPPEPLG